MFLHEDSRAYRDAEEARFGKQHGGSIRTPRNEDSKVASFTDYEKIRDGMKIVEVKCSLTCKTDVEKSQLEYDAWKSKQKFEDKKWELEQRLGFDPNADY